jgi:DNA-directed RNA polymerase specialized sigma24 family protein
MSRGLLEKFDDRLRPPERESLRTGKDFGIVLLRVITLPAASALAEALALRQVPEECAEPLRLRFLEHRDPDEIGVELRLTPLTVRRMLVRGLESWADRLPAADPEPVPLDSWRLE